MNIYQNPVQISLNSSLTNSPKADFGAPTDDVSKRQFEEAKARDAAQDFEAAFISQMLTFSGLDKALTAGGGDDMAAFTSFYIESFADQMAEKGGFGLAEKFYDRIIKLSELSQKNDTETVNDISNKL